MNRVSEVLLSVGLTVTKYRVPSDVTTCAPGGEGGEGER